jgi:hypothetical protein
VGSTAPLPELASTEALALIAYFAHDDAPTHVLRRDDAVPPQILASLLEESEKVRRENAERLADARVLRWAAPALTILAAILVVELVVLLWWSVLHLLRIEFEIPVVAFLFAVLTLALLVALDRLGLRLRATSQLGQLLGGGFAGVSKALAGMLARDPEPPARG